jgi:signal transduction histidine kinase
MPQQWAMGMILLVLHGVLLGGPGSAWVGALMMVHYGLFLLWQPIWRGEQQLGRVASLLFMACGGLLLLWLSWWLLAFWLAGLIGLLGGRVFSSRAKRERWAYLAAVGYLLTMLLIWVEPQLLKLRGTLDGSGFVVQYVLPVIPLVLLFVRGERHQGPAATLDFFYGLILFLLVTILVLASFVIQVVSHADYVLGLVRALFGIAAVLVLLSWLWNPRAGFAGLGQMLSRYLLSVGMPFEQWLQRIAVLAETTSTAAEFLDATAWELSTLPWVSGGVWQAETSSGNFGETSPHKASFSYHGLRLTLFSRNILSPALVLHIKLLAQLLGEFHEAKLREEEMRDTAYLQAVYETGARLTHDIKNLLQSLRTLCSAVELSADGDQARLVALIRRQLPQLTQRLQLTLDKLHTPVAEASDGMNAITWWNRLRQRYRDYGVVFTSDHLVAGAQLPGELFDSVADNLLQNAMEKRKLAPGLKVMVMLTVGDELSLVIEDDGAPIPVPLAGQLFRASVASASGLGIGLYQAAKMAQQKGYALRIASNINGAVRFELAPVDPAAVAAH